MLCYVIIIYVADEGGNNVLVKKMVIVPADHDEMTLDLTGGEESIV